MKRRDLYLRQAKTLHMAQNSNTDRILLLTDHVLLKFPYTENWRERWSMDNDLKCKVIQCFCYEAPTQTDKNKEQY